MMECSQKIFENCSDYLVYDHTQLQPSVHLHSINRYSASIPISTRSLLDIYMETRKLLSQHLIGKISHNNSYVQVSQDVISIMRWWISEHSWAWTIPTRLSGKTTPWKSAHFIQHLPVSKESTPQSKTTKKWPKKKISALSYTSTKTTKYITPPI